MRNIHENCEKTKWKHDLPAFPPKKFFGSNSEDFIQKRRKELENYYSTLLRTIPLEDLPEVYQLLNTNKPVREKKPPTASNNKETSNEKPQVKERQLKAIFEKIVINAEKEMVESNEFDHEPDDESRRKFNQEVQKLKLDLRSALTE